MLEATSQDQVGVWEIGMNHPGEIAPLAQLAQPDVAIITNIGIAHLEFMGSREAIAREKGDLAAAVAAGGTVILNRDDEFADAIAQRTSARVIFAGIDRGEVQAREIVQTAGARNSPSWKGPIIAMRCSPCPGCTWCRMLFSRSRQDAFLGSRSRNAPPVWPRRLAKARLQIREIHGVQFIDDSYNANPDSTKAALRTLAELETDGQRIAVLGEMAELGTESTRGHREVGQSAASLGINCLIRSAKGPRRLPPRAARWPNEQQDGRLGRGSGRAALREGAPG